MTGGLILFARMDSRRLPDKALLPIGMRPLIGHVIDRARRVRNAGPIVLATSDRAEDDPLAAFADDEDITCFRGALDDVAGRALNCARAYGFDHFARICGDRPFFDPTLTEQVLTLHVAHHADLTTTQSVRPYPPGLTTEVISVAALERACAETLEPQDREHVTRYFYNRPERFQIRAIEAPEGLDFTNVRLVVDDANDLARARYIVERLEIPAVAEMGTVIGLARSWHHGASSDVL